jgi:hypothetical protein
MKEVDSVDANDAWRARARVVMMLSTVLAAVWLAEQVHSWIAVDRCLDSGGRWEQIGSRCEPPLKEGVAQP